MVLWLALVVGLLTGIGVSRLQGRPYHPPLLRHIWLVFVGFLPQFLAIYLIHTRTLTPDWLAAVGVVVSQVTLFAFAWINRQVPGMPLLMIGLLLNLTVITANGGFMPIAPQTAERLTGHQGAALLQEGNRFGFKDILLSAQRTRFPWLTDRFLPPVWFPYQVAFSLGDVLIAAGVFQIFASQKLKG
ncbi:MAG: hypothetical protein Fur0043_02360 [Anaerolineales bacterium]